jgi:hypothetical protein
MTLARFISDWQVASERLLPGLAPYGTANQSTSSSKEDTVTHKDKVLIYALHHCLKRFTAPDAARAAGCSTQHAYKVLAGLRFLGRMDMIRKYRGRNLITVCYYVPTPDDAEVLADEVAANLTCTLEEAQAWRSQLAPGGNDTCQSI